MKSNPLENIFYFFRDRFVFPWIRIHNLACRLHLLQTQLPVSGRDESSLTCGISRAGWWTHNLAGRLLYNCPFQEGTSPVWRVAFHEPAGGPPHRHREPEDHRQQDLLQDGWHLSDPHLQGILSPHSSDSFSIYAAIRNLAGFSVVDPDPHGSARWTYIYIIFHR